jgi:lipoprotein-anchoring transpeptidase ErfK/SrfK
MRSALVSIMRICSFSIFSLLASCATTHQEGNMQAEAQQQNQVVNLDDQRFAADYTKRIPSHLDTHGKKLVLVDPNVHTWGAYGADGNLIRAGIATAGGHTCPPDADEADCRTGRGTYHITSLGSEDCASKIYPRPDGGGLMPYCMFFNNGQALHGSPDNIVIEDNVSHGCVRMRIPDAEWMRNNFAQVGTKVVVMPY